MRVLLTGGGTGGHLYPALAIGEMLKEMTDCEILFVGTRYGLESKIVPQMGYPLLHVWIRGLKRGVFFQNIIFPIRMLVSLIQSIMIIVIQRPNLIVGTGGYASWPVLSASILLFKKSFIQEQNQKPGLVTKILAPFVDRVYISFEGTKDYLRKKSNVVTTGNPIRSGLTLGSRKEAYQNFDLDCRKTTVFIFGGSQGALGINRAILERLSFFMKYNDIQMLWATGPKWYEEIYEQITAYIERIKIYPYIKDMHLAYAVSDLVICRSGATTISEVTHLGLPVVFIPFPHAAEGHQEENARALQKEGAAELITEGELNTGRFEQVLNDLFCDPKRRKVMAGKAKKFGKPEAAQLIVKDILHCIR